MAVRAASGVLSSCETDDSRLDLSRSPSRSAAAVVAAACSFSRSRNAPTRLLSEVTSRASPGEYARPSPPGLHGEHAGDAGRAADGHVEPAVAGRLDGPSRRRRPSSASRVPTSTVRRARAATAASAQLPAGAWQYERSSPSSRKNRVADSAPRTATTSLRQLSAICSVDVCETTAALSLFRAAVSFSRASARASRSRMRPAWMPTMTPTTRNATRDSQSLGSRISNVWYGGRKKKFQARKARTAARSAGPVPAALATSRMTSRYSSAHCPLAKVSRPGRKSAVLRAIATTARMYP